MTDVDIPNLDREISLLPEDIRRDLAERGRRNLYFLAKGVLGYRQMTEHCHKPLCVFLDSNTSRFKFILHPRGTFKTSVCTISRNVQRGITDPNARICIINEVADNAEGFLSTIRQHFEQNRVLRTLYSDVIPKDFRKTVWNNQALRLVRDWIGPEDTFEAMGVLSTLTSHHYTDITYDDIISEDAVKSPQVMTDTVERARKFRSLMVDPAESSLTVVGTPWAFHDAYHHLSQMLGAKAARYIRGAHLPDGSLLFPELLDEETLTDLRSEYGDYSYLCLYECRPRDVANQDFNIQDLRFWRWSSDEESVVLYSPDGTIKSEWEVRKLDVTVSVDLAVSEKTTSDRNAIVTCGVTPDGDAVVLDTFVKRCTPLEVIEHLFWLRKRFAVRAFGIESVAYQKAFKYFLRAECDRRNVYMNITELKAIPSKRGTGNNTKEMRIRGLQPVASLGHLYVSASMHILRNELADFPLGEHDDCIDALAHQLTMWRGNLGKTRMEKYKASEARLMERVRQGELPGIEYGGRTDPRDVPHPDDLGIEVPQFSNWQEVEVA
jgi:predicted phage terminase large subunit-like protein